jgi:hypothetical protein
MNGMIYILSEAKARRSGGDTAPFVLRGFRILPASVRSLLLDLRAAGWVALDVRKNGTFVKLVA